MLKFLTILKQGQFSREFLPFIMFLSWLIVQAHNCSNSKKPSLQNKQYRMSIYFIQQFDNSINGMNIILQQIHSS